MSYKLKQFLAEWLAWAEADAPEHPVFTAQSGLCCNLGRWSSYDADLADELSALLSYERYPFGANAYMRRLIDDTQHRDPVRLAWVRKQLGVA